MDPNQRSWIRAHFALHSFCNMGDSKPLLLLAPANVINCDY